MAHQDKADVSTAIEAGTRSAGAPAGAPPSPKLSYMKFMQQKSLSNTWIAQSKFMICAFCSTIQTFRNVTGKLKLPIKPLPLFNSGAPQVLLLRFSSVVYASCETDF